jgi:hypothetical protein
MLEIYSRLFDDFLSIRRVGATKKLRRGNADLSMENYIASPNKSRYSRDLRLNLQADEKKPR